MLSTAESCVVINESGSEIVCRIQSGGGAPASNCAENSLKLTDLIRDIKTTQFKTEGADPGLKSTQNRRLMSIFNINFNL